MIGPQAGAAPRSSRARLLAAFCAALLCAGFLALGTWQLQRLQWKNALVAQVDQRAHAAPAAAPAPDSWAQLSKDHDEYRHLRLTGRFLDEPGTLVQAATELGSGFWLLAPFRSDDGSIVIVNRGFVAAGARATSASSGNTSVTGLLRMSEHGGGFLHDNDPLHKRWYSRDVSAIAAARGHAHVAPYFLDQDAANRGLTHNTGQTPGATPEPVGGLTVISFRNNHLVYALTWYALGLMAAGACFLVMRERRADRPARD